MTSHEREHEPDDLAFEADLEHTLHDAVDETTASPDLRSAVEHVAARDDGASGEGAFAVADGARPSPALRNRVAAAIAAVSAAATTGVWWRRRKWAVAVAGAIVGVTMLLGALASAVSGFGGTDAAHGDPGPDDDVCDVPWQRG